MPGRLIAAPWLLAVAVQAAHTGEPGDAAAGKAYFTQICRQCHSAESGDGGGEIGPSLVGVYGRPAGAGDTRFVYSPALADSKLVWNVETLERFLADPGATVPGTTMPLPVPEKKDRDNVIAYFQSLVGRAK
ncbi:MAG TPA: c-type cytochrome [Steroidobacteraceae bacterium]|nr:c-type cytochrome [Steroidobacteraceae bacterium]